MTPPSAGADRRRARATAVAKPASVLIVATEVVAEAQVTWLVRFCGRVVGVSAGGGELLGPAQAMLGLAGVTAIDTSVAAVTVSTVEPRYRRRASRVIDDVPVATAVATPSER